MPYTNTSDNGHTLTLGGDLLLAPNRQGTFTTSGPPDLPPYSGLTFSDPANATGREITQPFFTQQIRQNLSIAGTYLDVAVVEFAKYTDIASDENTRNAFSTRIALKLRQPPQGTTYRPFHLVRDIVINKIGTSWTVNSFDLINEQVAQSTGFGFTFAFQNAFDINTQILRLQVKSAVPAGFTNAIAVAFIQVHT